MDPTALHLAFLTAAGVAAGIIGTAGGITSLVAYPALLAVGIPPLSANVTNSIALLGSGLGSSLGSRPELREHGATVRRWAPIAVIGAVAGAVLLLATPPGVFAWVVPFLVASAAALLLLQPRITRWHTARDRPIAGWSILAAVFGVAVYDGYFGAGSGVLMIAVILILIDHELARANALKNVLLFIADLLPAVLFALAGPVVWAAVLPLGLGALGGGLIGPHLMRRAPRNALRIAIALLGFGLAAWLLAQAIGG
ncbi:sulfite exporter TauE/SafE family protein [Lysinimonas soli]|uniref:Probable membrane transporter protein n=1 Tax=Lysinimonas soli TaxID=1074233 RepID=A0ABW0NMD1_9MICO